MKNILFWQKILALIFPNQCLACSKIIDDDGLFCNDDWQKLQFITNPKCQICSQPFMVDYEIEKNLLCASCLEAHPSYDSSIVVFHYNDILKKIIGDLKYRDATNISAKLSKFLVQKIRPEIAKYHIITAVPLHKKRLRTRKFNQSILLASSIYKALPELKFVPDLLFRTKYTPTQVGLKRSDRLKNLHGVFAINKKYASLIKGKTILLVDDVMTTGATVENCALTLKNAGAAKIIVATVAKSIIDQ